MYPTDQQYEELRRQWTDKFVQVNADLPELKRFAGIVGRVITVNRNGKAVVEYASVQPVVKRELAGLPYPPRELLTPVGFAVTDTVDLPDGPRLWLMWRDPQEPAA